ncbi:MAG: spore coat protein CotJB [Lachnospiraceae bacterium]|nr:spore coat protein CotJB [Lachnospiraceae bacterium]
MNDTKDTGCTCPETLAMASVPMQEWCEPYDFKTALKEGTIFPCLNLKFFKAEDVKSSLTSKFSALDKKEADREEMMSKIATISFAINDLTLYLDTHPSCPKGLALFKELLEQRLDLLAEYAKKYNPLTQISMITGNPDTNEYGWAEGPMPWEGGLI